MLVVILLRGGLDGLSAVVPFGDPFYAGLRPTLAISPPRRGRAGSALDLDGFFGLHPAMAPLLPFYRERQLAIVPAAGAPLSTPSHSEGQRAVEAAFSWSGNPPAPVGHALQRVADRIRAGSSGVACVDMYGWDTHMNQAGQLHRLLAELSAAVAGFYRSLGDRAEDVCVATVTEFGRTAQENTLKGTGHGHASAMFLLGGRIRGGRVLGDWPGLAPEQLLEGRALAGTSGFRELLSQHIHPTPYPGVRL